MQKIMHFLEKIHRKFVKKIDCIVQRSTVFCSKDWNRQAIERTDSKEKQIQFEISTDVYAVVERKKNHYNVGFFFLLFSAPSINLQKKENFIVNRNAYEVWWYIWINVVIASACIATTEQKTEKKTIYNSSRFQLKIKEESESSEYINIWGVHI